MSKLAAEQVEATDMIAAKDMDHALRLARGRIGETPGWWGPSGGFRVAAGCLTCIRPVHTMPLAVGV